VLQVKEPHGDYDGTWREATQRGTEVYLAAIDQLAREGLVDPARVGIGGYSRTGPYAVKSIVDAPDRFAAAAIANTEPGSLFGYYNGVDGGTASKMQTWSDFIAGSRPYGDGLSNWVQRAPTFHTDRIRAAVLVSASAPVDLIELWSLYAPLRDQHKPVELQYMRGGDHNLVKPLEILAHQELLVDWFDFWLNGHEAPDPGKAAQYARWHEMRRSLEARDAARAPVPAASE
jgi:dipeptidyl aminopeptidase/acylaminoacyl peptidase